MSILALIIVICVIALAFYANNTWVAPGLVRNLFNIVLMIVCIVVVLALTGLLGPVRNLRV